MGEDAFSGPGSLIDAARINWEASENGLWVWFVINLCATLSLEYPEWVQRYLVDAAQGLMALGDFRDPFTQPPLTETAAYAAWVQEGNKAKNDAFADERKKTVGDSPEKALLLLGLHRKGSNMFREFEKNLEGYLASVGAAVHGDRKHLDMANPKQVDTTEYRDRLRRGKKLFESVERPWRKPDGANVPLARTRENPVKKKK